jgi:hypothetical protein
VAFFARRKSPLTGTFVVDTTLDVNVEVKGSTQVSDDHLIYSVILACVGDVIMIFTNFHIINPEVKVHSTRTSV